MKPPPPESSACSSSSNETTRPPASAGALAADGGTPKSLDRDVRGKILRFFADRALYSAEERTLFLADAHFGKSIQLRKAGVPVSELTTEDDIARLELLLRATGAARLVVLGDLLHSRGGRSPALFALLTGFRSRWWHVELILVRGNHDRSAGDPPVECGFVCVDEPYPLGPFLCCHEHAIDTGGEATGPLVLCGHVHPVLHLPRGRGRGQRCPVFLRRDRVLLLPAFGSCTGGHRIHPRAGDDLVVVERGEVAATALR